LDGECQCKWLDDKHCLRFDLETCQALLKLINGEELDTDDRTKIEFVADRLKGIIERFDV
jgi:hypothetical protein